ncbi:MULTISPECIES: hypothetical protein [Bacillus cereus group]|uniref:hypothetical protein n=1 Tax=Bacillus cereus group TaxID=86661 RepID=UPI001BABD09A|nr:MULTISPECIES: hypothetical protein [Bacillus cereus group]MEC0075923.1 hypothetical protein [Bacillus anthracis]
MTLSPAFFAFAVVNCVDQAEFLHPAIPEVKASMMNAIDKYFYIIIVIGSFESVPIKIQ